MEQLLNSLFYAPSSSSGPSSVPPKSEAPLLITAVNNASNNDVNASTTPVPSTQLKGLAALKAMGLQDLSEWEADGAKQPSRPLITSSNAQHRIPFIPAGGVSNPILLGGPRSTEHIQRLYQICQVRGVTPRFEFEETGQQHWAVTLTLGEHVIRGNGEFATKQEGKESVAREGCDVVAAWPVLGAGSLGNADGQGERLGEAAQMLESQENWVGILLEFSTAHHIPQPTFQLYQLSHQTFATTVTLAAYPSFLSVPTLFGSATTPYNTKKAAKTAAAKEAVLSLRSHGYLGGEGTDGGLLQPPGKKRRLESNGTLEMRASSDTTGSEDGTELDAAASPKSSTQRINILRDQLGLPNLSYNLTMTPGTALYAVYATFEGPQGSLPPVGLPAVLTGRLGECRGVFGKKTAKEECAKVVVGLLEQVKEERLRELRRI